MRAAADPVAVRSVIPGSHTSDKAPQGVVGSAAAGDDEVPGSIALEVPAGTAVLFDRRVWHSASRNFSDLTRKGAPPTRLVGMRMLTVRRCNTQ